jgi:antitoxin VapB
MSLNIKNAETHRLVRELAELTGESMTEAVTAAVRERLERVRANHDDDVEARIDRIREIAGEIRRRAPDGYFDQDFDTLLYDENGLPR